MAKSDYIVMLDKVFSVLSDGRMILHNHNTDDEFELAMIDTIRSLLEVRGILQDFKADIAFYNYWAEKINETYSVIYRKYRVYVSHKYGADSQLKNMVKQKYGEGLLRNLEIVDPEWLIATCEYVRSCQQERIKRAIEGRYDVKADC